MSQQSTGFNAVKVLGEGLVTPGASLLLDGNIKDGTVHLLGGIVAGALLGPIGAVLVAANSYSRSVAKKNLLQHFTPGSS